MEKIKTIGDSYFAISGVPTYQVDHAKNAMEFSLEVMRICREELNLRVRIGLSSGPVTCGIIGIKKWVYDAFGNTINESARMEKYGVPGRIMVSRSTYELIFEDYPFLMRRINVQGIGLVKAYIYSPEGVVTSLESSPSVEDLRTKIRRELSAETGLKKVEEPKRKRKKEEEEEEENEGEEDDEEENEEVGEEEEEKETQSKKERSKEKNEETKEEKEKGENIFDDRTEEDDDESRLSSIVTDDVISERMFTFGEDEEEEGEQEYKEEGEVEKTKKEEKVDEEEEERDQEKEEEVEEEKEEVDQIDQGGSNED